MNDKPSDHRPSIKPRRAEPIQPDRPGRGTDAGSTPQDEAANGGIAPATVVSDEAQRRQEHDSAQKQKEQGQAALDNVREGYD